MKIKGRVLKYGDYINTDVIFPGRYTYVQMSNEEMAKHAMEDLDKDFVNKVKPGDIIVAGKNFGMGSSREQAALCLKYAGISCIIARSFSRIFFRNAINAGLPAISSVEAVEIIREGDIIEVDLDEGVIIKDGDRVSIPSYPESVLEILKDGGILEHTRKVIKSQDK